MSIYRSASIAGEYGVDLTEALFRKLGRSFALLMGEGRTVVVGGDARPATPALIEAFVEGLTAGGRVVADAGIAADPMARFAGRMLRSDAVALVTGQWGPPEQAGLVFSRGPSADIEADLSRLKALMEGPEADSAEGGEVESWQEDLADEYLAWLSTAVLPGQGTRRMKLVVDVGNEQLADPVRRIFEAQRGFEVDLLFEEVDGRFPGRGPDLSALGAMDPLASRVRESGAVMGIGFDGGGSRVRFVDERGKPVSPEAIGVALLRSMATEVSGRRVVVDARVPRFLLTELKNLGAEAVIDRDEPAFLRQRMAREDAAVGIGMDGVYLYGALGGDGDGLYTALRILEHAREGKSLSKLCQDIPETATIRDVRVPCSAEGVRSILSRIRAAFPREAQTEIEGLRLRLEDGWAAVLPRSADETLSFSFEGEDAEAVQRIAEDIIGRAVEVREAARRQAGLPEPPAPDPYAYLDEEDF